MRPEWQQTLERLWQGFERFTEWLGAISRYVANRILSLWPCGSWVLFDLDEAEFLLEQGEENKRLQASVDEWKGIAERLRQQSLNREEDLAQARAQIETLNAAARDRDAETRLIIGKAQIRAERAEQQLAKLQSGLLDLVDTSLPKYVAVPPGLAKAVKPAQSQLVNPNPQTETERHYWATVAKSGERTEIPVPGGT